MDLVHREAMAVKLRNMGQTCVSANRFFVHESVAEEFGQRLAAAFAELTVGNALDDGTDVGPLVEEAALVKVEAHVADAVGQGRRGAARRPAARRPATTRGSTSSPR